MNNVISIPPKITPARRPVAYPRSLPFDLDPSCVLCLVPEMIGAKWLDISGKDNHGTISGATKTAKGRIGPAFDFDGTNNYVEVAANSSLDIGNVTAEVWCKSDITDFSGGSRALFNKKNTNSGTYILFTDIATDKYVFSVRLDGSEGTGRSIVSNSVIDLIWHHVVGTYDGTILKMYIDGVLQTDTLSISGSINTDNSDILRIGRNPNNTGPWDGLIDEVRIFNKALSAIEIKNLYEMGRPLS